jgi:hypothetical protein
LNTFFSNYILDLNTFFSNHILDLNTFFSNYIIDLNRFFSNYILDLNRFFSNYIIDLNRFFSNYIIDLNRFFSNYIIDLNTSNVRRLDSLDPRLTLISKSSIITCSAIVGFTLIDQRWDRFVFFSNRAEINRKVLKPNRTEPI